MDMSTRSLGQGIGASCGMAKVAQYQGKDLRVYALLGNGELQEASMFAAHYKLDNRCLIVGNNGL